MVPTNVLHAFAGRLNRFRFCSFPEYSADYDVAQHVVGADAHIGPANIGHHRRIRRWPAISTAGCFASFLRGSDSRWERCLHAGGAVVQLCRVSIVCWPQRSSRGFFCGLRYNPIRIQRLFLHTFSDKPDGTKLQTSEAFAIWRGRTTERTRPAACGGARNVEFVRTSRRRHSCGVAASTAVR